MSARADALERFHGYRAAQLRRAVLAQVRTSDHTVVEDACQYAWLALIRRPDIPLDDRGAAWLATTAIREGWRLARVPRDLPAGTFRGNDDLDALECPEPTGSGSDPEAFALDRVDHDARVSELRSLPARQQQMVLLHAAGYRYHEIGELTDSTYTTVNRHLSAARARLAHQEWLRALREQRRG